MPVLREFLKSAKGAHTRRQTEKKLVRFSGGALDAAPVLREFLKRTGCFDVVFDVIGGDTLERSWPLLSPGGRMVTIASQSEAQADERVNRAFFIVEPNRTQLEGISDMLNRGDLRTVVDTVVPLAKAPEAYTGRFAGKRGRGKVVVEIATESAASNKPQQTRHDD